MANQNTDRSCWWAVCSRISVLNLEHREPKKLLSVTSKETRRCQCLFYEITGTLRKFSATTESCKAILMSSNYFSNEKVLICSVFLKNMLCVNMEK